MHGMAADMPFRLEPWDERGLTLERRANTAVMKVYLGGLESDETMIARHERILAFGWAGTGRMFLIVVPGEVEPVGSTGYWERQWPDRTVYEMGWKVLPAWQGRGLAAAATVAVIEIAATEGRHRWAHAYPKTDNAASNGVCRNAGFAGFALVGGTEIEYPPGHPIRCHDWRYDLASLPGPPGRVRSANGRDRPSSASPHSDRG